MSLQQLLDDGIRNRRTPCAVLSVCRSSGPLLRLVSGHYLYTESPAVQEDSLFDMASVTKVVVTTSLAMQLHEAGLLDLDAPVSTYLPEFLEVPQDSPFADDRRRVTIRHLLAHCSGLPPFIPYYNIGDTAPQSADDRRRLLAAVPLQNPPGQCTVYSDISMILMGEILSALDGRSLAVMAQERLFGPLGMADSGFNPPPEKRPRCVPTECRLVGGTHSGEPWQGIVHDENARWLGGVAGHAGLFSTAPDLERFARMLLNGGELDGVRFFRPETLRQFTRRANLVVNSSRCLGWDSPSGESSGGARIHPNSFGHTGFTGISFWINPEDDIAVCLLTNAVHPTRQCKGQGYFPWARRVHTEVYNTLLP